jgi:hypothetical protein
MKTFSSQTYYVCFKAIGQVKKIVELIDDEGKKYFFYGDPDPDSINKISGIPGAQGVTYSNNLAKAHNLFEAKALVIEKIIEYETQPFSQGSFSFDSCGLMRELGIKNLPLLLEFFTNEMTKTVFEQVLKYG